MNGTPLTYYPIQLFSVYSMRLFFRDVTVIGQENIPKDGPVLIYGNHNNQFVDGTVLYLLTIANDGQRTPTDQFHRCGGIDATNIPGADDQGYGSYTGIKTAGYREKRQG
jgi:hypothetical protein